MIAPRFRAVLDDGTKRERPLQTFGNDLREIRAWADTVLPTAADGGGVNVYVTTEVHVEMIPKPKKKEEEPAK